MRRRLFNLAAAVSLVLFVALILAWMRSTQYRDEYRFTWGGKPFAVASQDGRVVIDNQPQIIDFGESQARQSARFLVKTGHQAYLLSNSDLPRLNAINAIPPPKPISRTVFFYWIGVIITGVLPLIRLRQRFRRELRLYRKYHPKTHGHCWNCGYDLTGNGSGVCPECGEAIPAKADAEA